MSSGRYLPIYLNDHLAAATASLELLKRLRGSAEGPLAALVATLTAEVEEDRETLRGIMREAGAREDRVKVLAASAGEKLGRLKLNGHLLSPSPLSPLTELDALCLLIEGRRLLWRSLAESRAAGADFAALEERAARQLEAVEPHRRDAARRALG